MGLSFVFSVLFNAPAGPVLHRFFPTSHSLDISGSLGSGALSKADGTSLTWDVRLWQSIVSGALVVELQSAADAAFPVRLGWRSYGLGPVTGALDASLVSILPASEGYRCTGQFVADGFEVRLTARDLQGQGHLRSALFACVDDTGAPLFQATDLDIGFAGQDGLTVLEATVGKTPLASLSQLPDGQAEVRVYAKGLEAIGMARVGSDLVMTMPFHMLLR